jgi:hypothetical protein
MGKHCARKTCSAKLQTKQKTWIAIGASTAVAGLAAWGWIGPSGRSPEVIGSSTAVYALRERGTPLSPALFVGQTARAYEIAHEIPRFNAYWH